MTNLKNFRGGVRAMRGGSGSIDFKAQALPPPAAARDLKNNFLRKLVNGFINRLEYFTKMFFTITIYGHIKNNYPKVLKILYIIRFLFLIIIIIIMIWSASNGGSGTAIPLYHLYSILKSIFLILILIAGIFVVYVTFSKADNIKYVPTLDIEILNAGVRLVPYMYDLVAILILLGIIKAYYIRGCTNADVKKNPNVYNFIDTLLWIPATIIFLTITAKVLVKIVIRGEDKKDKIEKLNKNTGPFMSVSCAVIIAYFVMQFLENLLSNNIVFWMKLHDGATSDVDCVTDQFGTDNGGTDEGLDIAKNVLITVILSFILVIILIIQLIPHPSLQDLNMKIRTKLLKVLNTIFTKD